MKVEAVERAVRSALRAGAASTEIVAARASLQGLAEAALAGERAAFVAYQDLLWDLHVGGEGRGYGLRRWLCEACYEVEEAHVARVEHAAALPRGAFALRAEQEVSGGPPHEVSTRLFSERSTLAEFKVYLRHHWHRSRLFWRELAELGVGRGLADASVIFRNLYDESGGECEGRAHPFLLQKLLRHLGVPCEFDERPTLPEAQAYLNNRIRCARHPNPAWGLAVLFALEHGTPATHGQIYRLLRRFGIDEEYCEFHRLHMSADVEHAAETWSLIERVVVGADDQRSFLSAIRHHRGLGRRYFDEIGREMSSARGP